MAGVRSQLEDGQFGDVVSLDPGCRLTFSSIRRNRTTNLEQNIRYSSASYRYDSNQYRLNAKQQTNAIQQSLLVERQKIADNASCTAHAINFLSFELQHFERTNAVMMDKYLAKLNLRRHIRKQRAIAKIARTLVFGARHENERIAAKRTKWTQRRNQRKRKKRKKLKADDDDVGTAATTNKTGDSNEQQ